VSTRYPNDKMNYNVLMKKEIGTPKTIDSSSDNIGKIYLN